MLPMAMTLFTDCNARATRELAFCAGSSLTHAVHAASRRVHRTTTVFDDSSRRMRAPHALLIPLIFGSATALAQADAGTGPGCGNVTVQGTCDPGGTTVTYCNEEAMEVQTIVCTDIDPTARCSTISAEYGVDCAYPTGTECLYVDEEENLLQSFCLGAGPGCFETKETALCAENIGPCTVGQVGTCTGNNLLFDCLETQPWLVDCASFGGTCSTAACRDLEIGSFCDGIQFFCKATDRCLLNSCVPDQLPDGGTSAPMQPDAGEVGPSRMDAGTSGNNNNNNNNEEDDGCSSTSPSSGAATIVALIAIFLIARRRRE